MNSNNVITKKKHTTLKMIFAVALVVCACFIAFSVMSDDDASADADWYTFDEKTGVMTVTGPTTGQLDYDMRNLVKKVIITNTVTQIGSSTFNNCQSLYSVEFEDGCILEDIGQSAFNSSAITTFTVPKSVKTLQNYSFSNCQSLRSFYFESGSQLQSIGRETFNYCRNLETMGKIPASVTTIQGNAFYNSNIQSIEFEEGTQITSLESVFSYATGLKTAVVPDSVTSARGAFQNCTSLVTVTIGKGLTEIPYDMFYNCQSLRNVNIPDTITSIGQRAFYQCGIESITLNVDSIGTNVFYNCTKLKTVTFLKPFETIPDNTFYGCTSLTTVNGLENVKSFGTAVFQNCKSLTTFKVPDGVTVLSTNLFNGAGLTSIDLNNVTEIGGSALKDTQLTSIELGKVTKLGGGSLAGTKMTYVNLTGITDIGAVFSDSGDTLKKVVLDDSLTILPNYMFRGCSGLTSVEYGDNIISFGSSAFEGCTSLKEIYLPESLQTIGSRCFYQCTQLTTFTAKHNVNSLGTDVFTYSSVKSVDLSKSSITKLARETFYHCEALEELILPETLVEIEYNAITYCPEIKKLHIPSSVTSLCKSYDAIFCDCQLEEISGGEGLTYIASKAFDRMSARNINLNLLSSSTYTVIDGILCYAVEGGYHAVMFPEVTGDYVMPDNIVSMDGKAMKKNLFSATSLTFSPNMKVISIDISGSNDINDTLVKVVIPEGVERLLRGMTQGTTTNQDGAFDYCIALKEVYLPSTLLEIDDMAFQGCTSLESITLPENLEVLGSGNYGMVFSGCTALKSIELPFNISTLRYSTFSGCTSLERIDLKYVETVEQRAFDGCSSLKEIVFGQYMNKIDQTFGNCDSLETLVLDGVDLTVNNSFNNCKNLTKIVLRENVKNIQNSFANCPIETIEVSAENPYFYTTGGMLYSADLTRLVLIASNVTEVDIPDSVTSVSISSVPSGVKSVVFGSGLTNFYDSCRWFSGSKTLETVTIKNGYGRCVYCFNNCTSLKELNLNEGLTSVEIEGCTSLKTLVLPDTINQLSFRNMDVPELIINESNPNLTIDGNVVYGKTTNRVVALLDKKSVVLPDGISWDGTLEAENITIGKGVPSFTGVYLYGTKVLTIDSDVEFIGSSVLYRLTDLTDIYILGDAIEFDNYVFNGLTQEITIHSNIESGFLDNCVGPTFVYVSGTGAVVDYDAGEHVIVQECPPQRVDVGGTAGFTVTAEKGYSLNVTASAGKITYVDDMYSISDVPAGGTTITMTATFIGIPTQKIELERSHLTVKQGDKFVIEYALTPTDSSDAVVWSTSDDTVVSITNDGIVAIGGGKATVTATSGDQKATCEIIVEAPDVGNDTPEDNSLVITIGVCVAVLVLVGIACFVIRRKA